MQPCRLEGEKVQQSKSRKLLASCRYPTDHWIIPTCSAWGLSARQLVNAAVAILSSVRSNLTVFSAYRLTLSYAGETGEWMVPMLNTSQRASRMPPEASENVNEKSITEAEGALREFARDGGVIRRNPKDAADFVANVDLLAQRAASLVELRGVIRELQQLHDFLQSEGERLQREISEYAQLSKATTNSTRLIADNMTNWKKAAKESPL